MNKREIKITARAFALALFLALACIIIVIAMPTPANNTYQTANSGIGTFTNGSAEPEPVEEDPMSPSNDTLDGALPDADKQINASFNDTETAPETEPEEEEEEEEEEEPIPQYNETLDDASLITDKSTYSQGESVNISLLSVPSSATVNFTIVSPSSVVYIALEEETGLYSFTETTELGEYTISADLLLENETKTLTKTFEIIGEEDEKKDKEVFDLINATLGVDKATYAPGETVRIYLAAPPEVISNFSIISPAGIIYLIVPSVSGDYEFKPDSTGKYVIDVSLRADDAEKFLTLTAEFDVLDFDLEIVFGEPEQCEIKIGEPVNWSQHVFIANHENVSISNFSLIIPLPADYSNLSAEFHNHEITQISTRNCSDAECEMQDAIINLSPITYHLSPTTSTSVLVDLAAGETMSFYITYQTSPVQLEVTEECIDISELIPPEAFDIEIYEQISADEPALSTEIQVKQVKVWHNSSMHYYDIPVAIEADDREQIVELVEGGTGIEKEIAVERSNKTASWTIPELSNRTYAVIAVEQDQGDAEIDKPVEWVLNVSGTIVRYKTPAPYKTETEPVIVDGTWKKEITVGSNVSVHYSNVTAYSTLEEIEKSNLRLFWVVNESRIDVTGVDEFNVSFLDTNNNGILDFVTWNVPLLSNQSFEIEADITVINVQSYPTVGGNWTVRFETTGTANLTITAVKGTTWTNQPYECYDEATEVLTKEGWKLFKDLEAEEEVLTLNQETKEQEWQKPVKYLEYEYSDAMFELTLEEGSKLLVSPEHKVYGATSNQSSIISNPSSSTTNNFPLNSVTSCKSKDNAVTSFSGIGGWILNTMIPEKSPGGYKRVLKKSESLVISTDLLSLDKNIISVFLTPFGPYTAGNPSCSKNPFTDFGTFSSSRNFKSDIVLSPNNFGSIFQGFSNHPSIQAGILSQNPFDRHTSSKQLNNIANQYPGSFKDRLSMANLGVGNDISHNLNMEQNYLNRFSLMNISDIYDNLEGKGLYFLDSELNPVVVRKKEKVPYTGKIYGVTVKNHIILIRRGNSTPVWCGNSNYDLQFLKLKCGNQILNYRWINDSVFIENYERNETGYEISKVLTAGSHYLKFQFGSDVEYAHNWATDLSAWDYRQLINISNTAGDLSYHQVKIELNSSNDGSNWNWSNNGNDTRFTYYNSTTETETEIPFWIESWNSTAQTSTIWVNVISLANSVNTTIYLYYGNTSASSASNGTNTFEFFDDFPGASLNGAKWPSTAGTIVVSGGTVQLNEDDKIYSPIDFGIPCSMRARSKASADDSVFLETHSSHTSEAYGLQLGTSDAGTHGPTIVRTQSADGNTNDRHYSYTDTGVTWTNYAIYEITRVSTTVARYYQNDFLLCNETAKVFDANGYVGFHVWDSSSQSTVTVDWVFVRKYASPEPSVSIGAEETPSAVSLNITISTPQNNSCTNDNTTTISGTTNIAANITYSVDGGEIETACNNCTYFSNTTNELSDGLHNITVYGVAFDNATDTDSKTVYFTVDTTAPAAITSLANLSSGCTWINWNWTNPADSDFDHTEVWLNGTFYTNVTQPAHFYNATGLNASSWYEIQTRTVDNCQNINTTWVNDTAKTQEVGWWDSAWSYRRAITLQGGDSELTDFPYYIHLSDTTHMQDDGRDVRFIDGTTELDYEIENFSTNDAAIWVRIPSLPTSGQTIYMYYGNAQAFDASNASGVWDSHYKGVWHMPDNISTTYDSIDEDSEISTVNASQGVTTDGTYLWTTNTTTLYKYWLNGTLIDSQTTSGDSYSHNGDIKYKDGKIYMAICNYPNTTRQYGVSVWNAGTLDYETEYTNLDSYWTAGLDYYNGYWWVLADTGDPNWVHRYTSFDAASHDSFYLGSTNSQGITWVGDDIFGANHASNMYRFHWNGTGFNQVKFYQYTDGNYPSGASQGSDYYGGKLYIAGRDGTDVVNCTINDSYSATSIVDSTSNSNTGTKLASDEPDEVAGKIGMAQDFDGTDDDIGTANSASLKMYGSSWTIESWLYADSSVSYTGEHMLAEYGNGWTSGCYQLTTANDSTLKASFYGRSSGGDAATYDVDWTDSQRHHAAAVLDTDLDRMYVYYDGNEGTNVTETNAPGNSSDMPLWFACRGGTSLFSDVVMDEVRVSDIARSADWLNLSYEVVGNQSGKVTIGAEEDQGEGEDTYIPPDPTSLANSTGNFWVNHTWSAGSGNVTDSFNVSMNGTWTNDSALMYMNVSVGSGGWANITVWAWNASGTGTLSAGGVSDEVQAPEALLLTCTCGDICVNGTGWWRNNGVFNASSTQIQAAVDNAISGETIYVYNGTYSENVNAAKQLTLTGEGTDVVNVTNSTAEQHVFNVTANYVNISGFNVTGATGNMKAGIYIGNGVGYCNISDNTISENYIGIYLNSSSSDNLFANNTVSDNTWDLYIQSSASAFTNNTLNGTAVSLTYSGNVSLKGVGYPASDPTGWNNITKFINATNQSAGAWMFINFSYSDADVSDLDESSLKVLKYNGTAWVEDGWNGTRYLDTANNVVGVNITSFSVFAPMGSSTSNNPPVVTLNKPQNGSFIPNNWTILNATVTDTDNDNTTVYFYANNNSNGLNASEGLVYATENVANGTTLTYNLTALPIKPSEANLSLLMHFDNRSEYGENGTHVYDFSGNGNNGTVNGNPGYNISGGKFAGAFEFDGDEDYVTAAHTPLLNDFTFSMWIKPVELGTKDEWAAASTGSGTAGWYWHNNWETNNYNILGLELSSGSWSQCQGIAITDIALNGWHHVAFTKSSETGVKIYYDGGLVGNCSSYTNDVIDEGNTLYIGRGYPDGEMRYFDGTIDEVAIYNRSLSADEILNHYRLSVGKYYWKVNASDGVLSNESSIWNFTLEFVGDTYIPPDPINLANTTGNFWVNHTWNAGSGNVTDSFNVSMNGTWTNDSALTYMNVSVGSRGWANITVWAWNASGAGTLSAGCVSDAVQAPEALLLTCTCGDICVNKTGWWRNNGVLNTSSTQIQAAVDNAISGERIYVYNGTYSENIDVAKQLTLTGEGAEVVNVTNSTAEHHVFNVTANYVNISGFNVTDATGNMKAGIYIGNDVDHCNISDNIGSNNYIGIYLNSSSSDNLFANNTISDNTWDFYIKSSASSFTNNTLNGTTVSLTYSGNVSLKGVGSPASDPTGWNNISKFINATNQSAGAWMFLNFSYSDVDVSDLDESSLKVWKYNGTAWVENGWNGSRYQDAGNNVVGVNITSFSVFAPMGSSGNPPVVTLNRPENGSFIPNNWALLNATVTDADNDNMTVCFYANNNSNGLNDSDGLVYIGENVANGTTLTYNLTALPIKPSEANLSLLMHFDNRSEYGENSTHVYDFSRNGNNGTMQDNVFINSSGKFGGAVQLDGSGDYVSIPNSDSVEFGNINYTISAWIYSKGANAANSWRGIVSQGDTGCYGYFLRLGTTASPTSNNVFFFYGNGTAWKEHTASTISLNEWHHVAVVYEQGVNVSVYIDGFYDSGTNFGTGLSADTDSILRIGEGWPDGNRYFNGLIDDVAIYNRSLSADAILNHYRLGVGKYYWKVNATDGVLSNESDVWEFTIGVDQTAPSIQLNYPDDKANLNSSTVNFNWTATDNIDDVLLCNLTIDGVINQSDIASTSGQPTNYSVSGISTGVHNWSVTCRDDAPNVNTSETRTFGVNNSAPNVTLNSPPNGSSTPNNWAILNATVTDADNDPMTVYFYANNNSNGLNASEGLVYIRENVANGTTLTYNLTALPIKPSEANLSLLMHFDNRAACGENTTHVYDFSGNGNNGTVDGAAFNVTGGKFAGAFVFDGTDDYIDCGNAASLNIDNSPFTVSLWFNTINTTAGIRQTLLSKGNTNTDQTCLQLDLFRDANEVINLRFWGDPYDLEVATTITADTWHHAAFTYDAATKNQTIYLDGAEVGSRTSSGNLTGTNGDSIWIGKRDCGLNDNIFNGTIDEVALYTRTLSATEVLNQYRLGEGKYYWKVNATDGVLSNESEVWEFSVVRLDLQIYGVNIGLDLEVV